jgi:putative ABC transport system permease protein
MSSALFLSSLELGLIYGLISIGIYLSFRVVNFCDLAADGTLATGACVCAIMLKAGWGPIVALFASCVSGALCGIIPAVLNAQLKISELLSGILTAFILYSINLKITNGLPNIALLDEPSIFEYGKAPLILAAIYLVLAFILSYLLITQWGLRLRSIGQNPKLALRYGVGKSSMVLIALCLSHAVIALSGGLLCQLQGFADVSMGIGTVILGLVGIVLTEKLIRTKHMALTLLSLGVGAVAFRLIVAVALSGDRWGIQASDLNLITGLMIVALLGFNSLQAKFSAKPC